MVGAGGLLVVVLVLPGLVDSILVHGFPPIYSHRQPIRGEHFGNPQTLRGHRSFPQTKTQWTFSPTVGIDKGGRRQRTMLQKLMASRPLGGRFPVSRMRNPLAQIGRPENSLARVERIPKPVQIHCCVRYSPGFEPQYLDMRILQPQSTTWSNGGTLGRSPWESNGLESSGVTEEPPYDIPFPEYTSSGGNGGEGSTELELPVTYSTTSDVPPGDREYEAVIPRSPASSPFKKQRKRSKSTIPADAESGKKATEDEGNPLDDVPEPFRSWILAGENSTSTTVGVSNGTQPFSKIIQNLLF